MYKTIKFNFQGQEITVSICHGNVWLELGGVKTPLAMTNCQEGGRYAYLVHGSGSDAQEVRIYDNGEVYGAD